MTRRVPEGFDLAGVASPGDVVLIRIKRPLPPSERERFAHQLRYAAAYWDVRFVLLDDRYVTVDRGQEEAE